MPTTDDRLEAHSRTRVTAFPDTIDDIDTELAGLDALERSTVASEPLSKRAWFATWPKVAAVAIAVLLWQLVVVSHWRPDYVLPGPGKVFPELWRRTEDGTVGKAVLRTMQRMAVGFGLALVIGLVVGALIARFRVARSAFASFITGIQTMPSIAWFPLAQVLFQRSEGAIRFVVVLGAAPAIANGLISGADNVPPLLLRSGRVLGAKGFGLFRTVTLPASLPNLLGGLKQGWAFAWRSLMAGELIMAIAGKPSLGSTLDQAHQLGDYPWMMAMMIVILIVGIVIDVVLFGTAEKALRRRWGLLDPATN